MTPRSFVSLCALVACVGCGTKIQEQYQIDIATPGGDDYLTGATSAVLEIGSQSYTSSVTPGAPFVLSGNNVVIPAAMSGIFRVKVLNAQGQVLAQGQSPEIELLLASPPSIRIFVQKPGSFGRTHDLDFPRRHMIGVAAPAPPSPGSTLQAKPITVAFYGLGTVVVPSGTGTVEQPTQQFQIYNPLTHFPDDDGGLSGSLGGAQQPRTDAAAVFHVPDPDNHPDIGNILVFGGVASPPMMNVGPTGQLDIISVARTDFEVFTPSATVRSPEPPNGVPRAHATMVDTAFSYAIGGVAGDQQLDTIVKIDPSSDDTFKVLPAHLAGPRVGHTATVVTIHGMKEVLIFGGAPNNVAVAEVLAGDALVPTMGNAGPARRDHAAILLPDGRIIILGGRNDSGVLGDSVLYQAEDKSLAPGPITLKTPRYGFAAFVVNDDLVVAGGFDGKGATIGTAEIYSAADLHLKQADVPCFKRAEPTVVVMPNESVLLLGGTEDGDKASIVAEIYQPLR
jgi:hypothetical protein